MENAKKSKGYFQLKKNEQNTYETKIPKKKERDTSKGTKYCLMLKIHRCHERKILKKRSGALEGARYCFVLIC